MRILQVNVIYGHGSTGKIVQTLHEEYLRQGHDSHVFFGRGPKSHDNRVVRVGFLREAKLWRFIQLFTGNFLAGSPLSTRNLKRHIKKLKPDVVHLHCINGNMCNVFSLLKWLRKKGYKTVLTHHAKFMFTGGCGLNMCEKYTYGCGNCPRKREVFGRLCGDKSTGNVKRLSALGMDGVWIKHTYVSPWLKDQADLSPLLAKANNHVVLNPVDTSVFNPVSMMLPLNNKPYAFFPTSLHSAVKGWKWVETVGAGLNELGMDLLVTGSGKESFVSPNIIDVGHISDQNLMAEYYRQAKVALVLSQCESFSMPVAESLCCGTPVCGFKAGGPESFIRNGCFYAPYGNIEKLANLIKEHCLTEKVHSSINLQSFAPASIAEMYIDLYCDWPLQHL